jgi:hypothetical protein
MELVGALRLDPTDAGIHGDVAAYKDLAFVGKWRGRCPGTGVDIVDIRQPTAPRKLADTEDHANTSMEDMEAIAIGGRDVLAIGLQACRGGGRQGLELVDITDPARPETLSFFPTAPGGVHELDLTTAADGRALALLAVPDREAATAGPAGQGGGGDLLIVDISDPSRPALLADWGVLDEPALGEAVFTGARQGEDARVYLHSVRADARGARAYLSYWDAGVVALDIAEPSRPLYLGRTTFAPGEEGNAHSIAEAAGGAVMVQVDEDYTAFGLRLTLDGPTGAAGAYPAAAARFARPLDQLPDGRLTGEVVHVGRGCPAGVPEAPADGDAYLADPAGKIALIERGACQFDNKVARAERAGATAVIIYNSPVGGQIAPAMGGSNPVAAGASDLIGARIGIPALSVGRGAGEAIVAALAAGSPASVSVDRAFDGWGGLRFFNVRDPARPVELGRFATALSRDEATARRGVWSAHNAEVRGSTLFASWYSDGVRALDIADPAAPREIGSWAGLDAPPEATAVDIWGVALHGSLVLASDRNFGLYILRLTPPEPPEWAEPRSGHGWSPLTRPARPHRH